MEQGAKRKQPEKLISKLLVSVALSASLFAVSLVGALLLALSVATEAQQPQKTYKVGRLSANFPSDPRSKATFEAFRQGLRDLGWVEGRNISVEDRWAGERAQSVPDLAAELVRLQVDVIVAVGSPVIQAAKQATSTIPIIMAGSGADPVAAGFVSSLRRPGGNITGLSMLSTELSGKRLELLKDMVSNVGRVAVLRNPNFRPWRFSRKKPKSRPNHWLCGSKLGKCGPRKKSRTHFHL